MPQDFFPFGVEIEVAWKANGARPFVPGGYHSGTHAPPPWPEHWRAEFDRSIRPCGIEFVSPVVRDLRGMARVVRVLDRAAATGGRANDSCGAHVHVGFGENYLSEGERVFENYGGYCDLVRSLEEGLFALTASLHRYRVTQHAEPFKKEGGRAARDGDHYRCLNRTRYYTLEHRFPAGSLEPAQVFLNVALTQGLVHLYLAGERGLNAPRPAYGQHPIQVGVAQARWLVDKLGWRPNGGWTGWPYDPQDPPNVRHSEWGETHRTSLPGAEAVLAVAERRLGAWERAVARYLSALPDSPGERDDEDEHEHDYRAVMRRRMERRAADLATDPVQRVFAR